MGENVHKFVSDFKRAVEADQIRVMDEIKTLRKYLAGDALTCIGENTPSLKDAFDKLLATFGDPQLLWKKHMEVLSQSLGKAGTWGKADSIDRRNAISKLIDFLNEATHLSKEHPTLEREIVCNATYQTIYRLIPRNIQDDIVKKNVTTKSIEERFKLLGEILLEHCQITIERINMADIFDRKTNDPKLTGRKFPSNNVNLINNHDCSKSHQCQTDWDFLGCIKLYSIKKVDERRELMIKNKVCFRCGSLYKRTKFSNHRCFWKNGKEKARCNVQKLSLCCSYV